MTKCCKNLAHANPQIVACGVYDVFSTQIDGPEYCGDCGVEL